MRPKQTTFFCFSPPVMLASFAIETVLFMYTVVRYKMTTVVRLSCAILFSLAVFQLAEYNVCGGMGASAVTWSRVGFVVITLLPALGIHLSEAIAGKRLKVVRWAAYVTALMWVLAFAFSEMAFSGHTCEGNYVIFRLKPVLDFPYYLYYYGWLLAGIGMSLKFAKQAHKAARAGLLLLVAGYLVFLVPTTLANTLNRRTVDGIPSIMCGFAVLFAFILAFGIVPTTETKALRKRLDS